MSASIEARANHTDARTWAAFTAGQPLRLAKEGGSGVAPKGPLAVRNAEFRIAEFTLRLKPTVHKAASSARFRVAAAWHAHCKAYATCVFFPVTEDRKMEMFLAVLLCVLASDAPAVSNPGFEQVREQTGLPEGWAGLPEG